MTAQNFGKNHGPDRCMLDDFLHPDGKKKHSGGKDAKKYNELLAKAQCKGKVEKVKPDGRTGSKQRSTPKAALRAAYKCLR